MRAANCVSTEDRTIVLHGSLLPKFVSFVDNSLTSYRTAAARGLVFTRLTKRDKRRYAEIVLNTYLYFSYEPEKVPILSVSLPLLVFRS